ncbi:MAG: hypothetical protein J1F07_06930 [Muribaculaceae bacterium]|nr:hypothetical protein [Muribaculaceae bacterium]
MNKQGINVALGWGILLLIAVLFTLMTLWTPPAYDDWIFMAVWREVNGDASPGLGTMVDFWREIRLYDNGRLANVMAPLSVMFSPGRELFPLLNGLCVAAIVGFASRLAFGRDWLRPVNIALCWLFILFLLPWRNSLFVADYALNYIWSAAITMAFMVSVVRRERLGWNPIAFVGALLLAFIAGGWHEGFAVPTLTGFLVYSIAELCRGGRRLSWCWWAVGVFYAAVTLFFVVCPGMLERSASQLGVANPGGQLFKLAFDFMAVIFLCLLIIIWAVVPGLRRGLREACSNVWFLIGSGIVVVGVLLSLLFTHQPRSAFWPDLWAIIMIFILARTLLRRLDRSRFAPYVAALSVGVCIIPMGFAISWQRALDAESAYIMAEMERSESGTVFHDVIPSGSVPLYTLKMPNHAAWVTGFHFHTIREYSGKPYPAVVPVELAGAVPEKEGVTMESTEAGQAGSGALKVGESIVLPYVPFDKPLVNPVGVRLADGTETNGVALFLPYMGNDGIARTYVYVYFIPASDITGIEIQ